MRLLIVNPNTTADVTNMLAEQARRVASAGTEILAVTAPFGVPLIETPAEAAIAAQAVTQALAEAPDGIDAGIVGGFIDPGLEAGRDLMPYPLTGLGEASMFTACLLGARFTVLTGGTRGLAPITALAERYGLARRLACVRAIDAELLDVAANQEAFRHALLDRARQTRDQDPAEVVILGGAVFAGMAEWIRDSVPVPILDPIHCAVLQAEVLARVRPPKARPGGKNG